MRDLIQNLSAWLAAQAQLAAARATVHRERVELTAWAAGYREGKETERELRKEMRERD